MGPPPPPHVVLYERPGCSLCAEARAVLDRVAGRVGFTLARVDIESDDALHARYLERIPVITIDGREAFELVLDERQLTRALERARARRHASRSQYSGS